MIMYHLSFFLPNIQMNMLYEAYHNLSAYYYNPLSKMIIFPVEPDILLPYYYKLSLYLDALSLISFLLSLMPFHNTLRLYYILPTCYVHTLFSSKN